MITVFEKIPDLFIEVYDFQFQTWGREFRQRGNRAAIVFRKRPGEPALLDGEGREVLRGAWLEAERTGDRMIIRPASEHDAEMIERHVREMRAFVLQ